MSRNIIRNISRLEIEEKVLNAGSLLGFLCVFFPWISGQWLGDPMTHSGLGFFTSFIGLSILLLHLGILIVTIIPITGGPEILKPSRKDSVRLLLAVFALLLAIAAWSVLTNFTMSFSRIEIRYGMYGTIVGSVISSLYSFLNWQEGKRSEVHNLFHQKDQKQQGIPPPEPESPEDHKLYS